MSLEIVLIVLAVWTVVGLLIAIAFGHMVPRDEDSRLASATRNVSFFRSKQREVTERASAAKVLRRSRKQRDASS